MAKRGEVAIIGCVTIADKIKDARVQRGWTQQQAAEYFGVSIPAFQNWEKGIKPPGKSRLEVIADWVGVPVDDLGPLKPKPLANLVSEEAHGLRQQLLESKESEIARLHQEIEDIRTVADAAYQDFGVLREFVEPRLQFLESDDASPLTESLVMNYRLLSGQLERQLSALSRSARGTDSTARADSGLHRNNASQHIGSRRKSFDSQADQRQ